MTNHLGDLGQTVDFQNNNLPKNHPLINAIGEIDELIAQLGLIRYILKDHDQLILQIQKQLQSYCSLLAGYDHPPQHISLEELEKNITQIKNQTKKQITTFYLPGDKEKSIFINIARTVCRRCERSLVSINPLTKNTLAFFNRLSDLLFNLQLFYDQE